MNQWNYCGPNYQFMTFFEAKRALWAHFEKLVLISVQNKIELYPKLNLKNKKYKCY